MVRLLVEHGAAVFAKTVGDEETALDKCEENDTDCNACFQYLTGVYENVLYLTISVFSTCVEFLESL